MLPFDVIVQEKEMDSIEVAAIDPAASMQAIKNDALITVAENVRTKLKLVIQNLKN
jgi:uncharacterized protein (DUF302 family)